MLPWQTLAPLTDLLYTLQTHSGGLAPSHVEHSADKSCLPVISLTHYQLLRTVWCQEQAANEGMDVHTSSGMHTRTHTHTHTHTRTHTHTHTHTQSIKISSSAKDGLLRVLDVCWWWASKLILSTRIWLQRKILPSIKIHLKSK